MSLRSLFTGKDKQEAPEVEIQGQPPLLEQLRLATQERPGEELTSTQRRQIGQEAAIRTIADIIDITPAGLVIAQNIPALGKLIGRIPIGQSTLGKLVSTPVGPKTFTNIIRKFKGQPVVGTFKGDPSKVIEAQFKVEEIRTNPIARDAFIRDQQEAAGLIRKPKGLLPSPEEVTRIDTIKLPTQKLAIQQTISDIKLNFPQASIIVKRTTELGLNKKDINLIQRKRKFVWIKQGIPFTPVFLFGFSIFFYFWKTGLWKGFGFV
ncbi:MAG: hypothetical protein IH845_05725 [Nanoarchaeota archaeon]|nr:hypothetical protein [Nanoarchaeota archaeon]